MEKIPEAYQAYVTMAVQGSLASFASGVMILFFRPFVLADQVTIAGHLGFVKDIGLFATTLFTADNEKIIVPNSAITSGSIINHTTLGNRRGHILVGLSHGVHMQRAQEVLLNAARRCPLVLKDPEASVAFVNFGASAVDFDLRPWSISPDFLPMLHAVRVAVY